MEMQPQNPEFRNNPENFHPCKFCCIFLNPYPANVFFLENELPPAKFCSTNWRCSRTVLEHLELF